MFLTPDTEETGHGVISRSACDPAVRVYAPLGPERGCGGTLTSALGPDYYWGFSAAAAAADVSTAAAAAADAAAVAALKHVFVIQSFSSRERRPAKHGGWRVRSMGGLWVCAACAHRRLLLMFNRLLQPS